MRSPTPKDLVCKNSTIPAFAPAAAMARGPSADSAPSASPPAQPPITLALPGGPPEGLGVFKAENLLAIRTKDGFSTSHYKDGVLEGELGQYLSHECSDEGEHLWRLLHA